jgi:hypothetical protein
MFDKYLDKRLEYIKADTCYRPTLIFPDFSLFFLIF